MKKAVIFDMDGLMIDSERVTYEEYCRKLEQLEYHFDENMYRRCLGKNKQSVYQVFIDHYGEDFPITEVWNDVHVSLDHRLQQSVPLKTGILELLTFLKENGYKIPDDVAVMGLGDIKIAAYMTPGLTTVHYHFQTMGAKSANLLMQLIQSGKESSKNYESNFIFNYRLIERDSV